MNKRRAWIGVAAFLACIAVLTFYLLSPGSAVGQLNQQVTGVVEGTEVNLAFKMSGQIEEITVKEGDRVTEGQTVAKLTSDELLAKRDQAKAAYELALAKLEQAKQGVGVTAQTSDAQIAQAKAAVAAAQAQYEANKNGARPEEISQLQAKLKAAQTAKETAENNLKRMQNLLAEGAVPQVQVEEAQAGYEKAAAELSATQEQLAMAKSGARQEQVNAAKAQWEQAQAAYEQAVAGRGQVGVRESDVKSADAGVKQAKGALDEMEAYLRNTILTSPVAGTVKSVTAERGELVAQGAAIVTIQSDADLFVKLYVDENQLGHLQAGDLQTLYVPALQKEVQAKVLAVSPAADFAVKRATQELGDRDIRAFQVKFDLAGTGLRPGLTVEWRIEGE
ncbi:HlyD family secretion protein [Brevibacillus sp. B_LB10_24]|uniref:HlyD family secretion protein n=1 Tax=Brevibacillus sp. B_LB10_24 TaxID=3380645 RepID=UPI0038BC19D4